MTIYTTLVVNADDLLKFFFFFQAEDGIRDRNVTGVQTCALPISAPDGAGRDAIPGRAVQERLHSPVLTALKIGRASCRESVDLGGRRISKKKKIEEMELGNDS